MKKCYIITSYIEGRLPGIISPGGSDIIICADGGFNAAMSFGLTPDVVIGDFDSGDFTGLADCGAGTIHYPREKDESDTFLCLKYAINAGYDEITVVGGIGGRLDHTVANIQTLAYFASPCISVTMLDERNAFTVIENSAVTIKKREGYVISLFSLSDKCKGVATAGLNYPLDDAELTNLYPVGLSNEFSSDEAEIKVRQGKLLIVMSKIN